jgi:folate-binding protein YgfZ
MSHCQAALLVDRGVLRVTGADARKLLHGIITSDIDKVGNGAAVHAGLLSPQGKILFDFFVATDGDGFLIEAARDTLPELSKRLGFYRLRSEVEITQAPDIAVAAVWGESPVVPDRAIAFADPRLPALGTRVLLPNGAPVSTLSCADAGADAYHAHRIELGVPEGGVDYAFGDTFPHEALFDQLNGVDFNKGCFVGQEVVARMQYRGTTRKRVVPVEGDATLNRGEEVRAGDLPVGRIGSVDGRIGLALLHLDRAADAVAKGTPLTAGDTTIMLHKPQFAQFDVPEAMSA